MIFIGDIHGLYKPYLELREICDQSLALGDQPVSLSGNKVDEMVELAANEPVEMPLLVFSNQNVDPPQELLKLMPNGDIYVWGRKAGNDQDVVDGMRKMFKPKS